MTQNERNTLKTRMLEEQGGRCAICHRPAFCSACHFGLEHLGNCRKQAVNTLDHNHAHKDCNGCDLCARGMTHRVCNRLSAIVEINPHLQNPFWIEYFSRGVELKG